MGLYQITTFVADVSESLKTLVAATGSGEHSALEAAKEGIRGLVRYGHFGAELIDIAADVSSEQVMIAVRLTPVPPDQEPEEDVEAAASAPEAQGDASSQSSEPSTPSEATPPATTKRAKAQAAKAEEAMVVATEPEPADAEATAK